MGATHNFQLVDSIGLSVKPLFLLDLLLVVLSSIFVLNLSFSDFGATFGAT